MELVLNKEYTLKVLKDQSNFVKDFSILQDEYGVTHYYPRYISEEEISLIVIGKNKEKYLFSTPKNKSKSSNFLFIDNYEENKIYPFKFVETTSYCNINDKKEYQSIVLNDLNFSEKKITTSAYYWQMYDGYYEDVILCEITKKVVSSDRIHLKQSLKNLKHPIFEINKEYEFFKLNEDKISGDNGYVSLRGIDGLIHNLHKPFEMDSDKNLIYRYFGINKAGKLIFRQFVNFEKIVKYRALKRLTYDKFREIKDNPILSKMFEDYDRFQNLWIISFCNILEEEFSKNISSGELEESLIYIEVLIEFENWILNSGFMNTFNQTGRESLEEVTKQKLKEFNYKKIAIEIVINNYQEKFFNDINIEDIDVDKIYISNYIFNYTSFDLETKYYLDISNHIDFITKLGLMDFFVFEKNEFIKLRYELITSLLKLLGDFEKKLFEKLFINSSKRDNFFTGNKDLLKLSNFILLIIFIYKDLDKSNNFKLSLAKFFKYNALYTNDKSERLNFLKISIMLLFNKIDSFDKDIFNWKNYKNLSELKQLDLINYKKPVINKINTLKDLFIRNTEIEGNLKGANIYGYEVDILGNKAILPYKLFTENRLSDFLKKTDRILKCDIFSIDEYFGNIYVNARVKAEINLFDNEFKQGSKVKGYVKSIEDYGVFIDLGKYDGLLHNSEISFHTSILSMGEELELIIIEISEENGKKLISLTLNHKLLNKELIVGENYECYYFNTSEKFVNVITRNGSRGFIKKSNLSHQSLDFSNYFNRYEKINVKLIKKNNEKLEFNSKDLNKNPFLNKKEYINKTYKVIIHEINDNIITIKFIDFIMIGYHKINLEKSDLSKIDKNDIVDFEIIEINSQNKTINGTINFDNVIKQDFKHVVGSIDNIYYSEIANCYEHFAYTLNDTSEKTKYLNIAKNFYGYMQSSKSYYLDIFIRYQEVIYSMKIDNYEDVKHNIDDVKVLASSIINFIKDQNLTIKFFPNLELIKQTLEILCCYNLCDEITFKHLIDIMNESISEPDIVSKMASLVLSTNSTPIELKSEKFIYDRWILLYNYLKEGLLKIENEDETDIELRNSFLTIIKQGENNNNEFKASIFKPVHDQEKRVLIKYIGDKLLLAEEATDNDLILLYQSKLNEFNNFYSIKGIKHSAMKSLVAFANTDGGNLIIGLEDNSNVLGVEYESNTEVFDNNEKDKYLNKLDILINEYIGNNFQNNIVFTEFIKIGEKNLLWIKIDKSNSPVFLRLDKDGKPKKEFYIRGRVSSRKLEIDEIYDFCKDKFI